MIQACVIKKKSPLCEASLDVIENRKALTL